MKNLVVAYDKQRGIGKENNLLWNFRDIPRDMAHFRQLTLDQTVIMGRKTLDSMGGHPLPQRRNIVVSRKALEISGVEIVGSLGEAYQCAGDDDIYVIGGGEIYTQALADADRIYATELDYSFGDAEVFFPVLSGDWSELERVHYDADKKNIYPLDFVIYEQRKAR